MEQLGTVPSWENGGFMKKIGSQTIQFINTPTISLSKTFAPLVIISKCPLVMGSKLPG